MADIEKLKTSIAKVKALTGKEIKTTTVETTTVAPAEEYPLNHE